MRACVAALALVAVSVARPAFAQDPPPPIPWVVVDLHAFIPRFPTDDADLALSRNMQVVELPGAGLGAQVGLHLYPLHTRIVTVGVGGEIAIGRARQTPAPGVTLPDGITPVRKAEERIMSASPQLSLNFGNGSGWSYLSVGLGATNWYLAPEGLTDYPPNSDRLKTFNYGGGARWFIKPHLAFSFDARFYVIGPGFSDLYPGTPRTRLFIVAAGVSLK